MSLKKPIKSTGFEAISVSELEPFQKRLMQVIGWKRSQRNRDDFTEITKVCDERRNEAGDGKEERHKLTQKE